FMIVQRGIPVQLPRAATSSPERSEALEVSVDRLGHVFVEGAQIEMEELSSVLLERANASGLDRVSLRGDRMVSYDRIMEVLDRIRRAGIAKVNLETRGEEG
ncbi:MAG: ExbD/TolR family protein, partial [Thermodesulfobacteriota bacterium]